MIPDRAIRELRAQSLISIEPFHDSNLQPVSYDVHLGKTALVEQPEDRSILDLGDPGFHQSMLSFEIPGRDDPIWAVISPLQFLLGELEEHFSFNERMAGRLEGKSTLGRVGLFVHITAGLFDPGWFGTPTIELFNASRRPIRLWKGMKIGQMVFEKLEYPVDRKYGHRDLNSHYQGDKSVRASRGFTTRGEK